MSTLLSPPKCTEKDENKATTKKTDPRGEMEWFKLS